MYICSRTTTMSITVYNIETITHTLSIIINGIFWLIVNLLSRELSRMRRKLFGQIMAETQFCKQFVALSPHFRWTCEEINSPVSIHCCLSFKSSVIIWVAFGAQLSQNLPINGRHCSIPPHLQSINYVYKLTIAN